MRIPLYRPRISEEAIAAATEVLRSGWIGLGPRTTAFENAFASYSGASHAVATSTCTAALHIAVRLLGLSPGTQVITTPVTFVATNQALLWEGLEPVFADVNPLTGNIDPASVPERLTDRTGAIMAVHFGGYACDLDALAEIARPHKLPIIEDAAHASGAWYRGRRVGSSGNLCAFSFGPPKNLSTGDGGMLIVRDADERTRAASLRYLGITRDIHSRLRHVGEQGRHWEYDVPITGMRYHMNDIAAAMGLAQLPALDEVNCRRAALGQRYRELLDGIPGIRLLAHEPDRVSNHHLFCILAENRDALADALQARGVVVSVHYHRNDLYPIFRQQELPGAEHFCQHVLSLPMHLDLTDEHLQYIAASIRKGW